MPLRIDRTGEQNRNTDGYLMTIIQYKNNHDIIVQFENGYQVHTDYDSFRKGLIRDRFSPSVYGVGVIGELRSGNNYEHSKEYATWKRMLERCFSDDWKKQNPHYKNTTCCEEWFYYPNFYDWITQQENYDKWLNGSYWALDKDIINKGNQIYSPDNCCLVPQYINQQFIKPSRKNITGYRGVRHEHCKQNLYYVCFKNENNKYISRSGFTNPEDAFEYYKKAKKEVIRKIAEREYSLGNISTKCYEAMINYEV